MKKPAPETQIDPKLADFIRSLARDAARKDCDALLRVRDRLTAEQEDVVDKLGWKLNMTAIGEAVESDEQFRKVISDRIGRSLQDLIESGVAADRLRSGKKRD